MKITEIIKKTMLEDKLMKDLNLYQYYFHVYDDSHIEKNGTVLYYFKGMF